MRIVCRQPRSKLNVTFEDGASYDFELLENGKLVCDVDDQDHLSRFLSLPEGYRPYVDAGAIQPKSKPGPNPKEREEPEEGEKSDDSGNFEQPEEAEEREEFEEDEVNDEEAAKLTGDRKAAVDLFTEKFGKAPDGRWSVERILSAVEDSNAE